MNILDLLKYGKLLNGELQQCESLLENNAFCDQQIGNLLTRINELKKEIKKLNITIKKVNNFHREEYLEFATELLNQNDGDYVFSKVLVFDDENNAKFHYYISDPSTSEFLRKDVTYESDLNNIISSGMLDNTIHFREDNFSLLDGNYNINSELCKSDLLKEASIKAMQIKLDNPYITNAQRLDSILESNKKELTK